MAHFLSVKNENGEYKHHKVPKDVYLYVRQLEMYFKYPEKSKFLKVYKDRFGEIEK